jgi:hypothetical protein
MTSTGTPTSPAPRNLDPTPTVRFLDQLGAGGHLDADLFADDVAFDATVPNWRFELTGADAVRAQLGTWFAIPGAYEWIRRQPTPSGELVEFVFTWEENGVPHAVHQLHLLDVEHGRIWRDTMFCGGRWPAPLLAEMEAARA